MPENSSKKPDFEEIRKYFPVSTGSYLPAIFPLGYFVRRSEPRLLYVMPVNMVYEGHSYDVKTKNISSGGIQVYMPRTFIMEGKTVQITFSKFKVEQNSILGGMDEFTNFENINYRIKEVQHIGEKTYISLIQQNLSFEARDFIQRFINGNRIRYKIDATDMINASKAQYYENLYTINMQHVPIFIRWNKDRGFHIDTIIKTERNQSFFENLSNANGHPDFRSICLPSRIEKLAELARDNQSCLFFVYRDNERLHSLFDFEFKTKSDLINIIMKVKSKKGFIYKASTNLNKKPAPEKITSMLSKIQKIDAIASKAIDQRASESIAQVIFTDITSIISNRRYNSLNINYTAGKSIDLEVMCENQKVRMADSLVIETYNDQQFQIPQVITFTTGHNRYDPRYQYEMDVSVIYNGESYNAKTIDFSRSGLGMVINQNIEIKQGSMIEITFSSLMIKGISTQLQNIPHRVMISRKNAEGLFLGVIRNSGACHPDINRFFSKLVKRNQSKLELCVKDKIDSVSTTFFEAFVTENIQTIPVIIARDKVNQHYIREIGLNDNPCPLAEKLYLKGQRYDFRFLTTELRLREFHQRTIRAADKNSQSFMLFFFKGINEEGRESIFSVTDFELILDEQIDKIIKTVLKNNGACVRVRFINNLIIDKLYQTMTIDKVDKLNKSSARILSQEYKDIIGFAEMLDLTDEYRKQYQFKS